MSSEKKFRIQNGLDVAGEVFVNGINIVGADGVLNEASYQTAVQAMIDATVAQGVDQGSIDSAVTTAVSALADSAPATLDTLNELAAALGDDADFATSMTNALNTKLNAANNLSDVADAAAARSNLGLGTAATAAITSFATAAQGLKADSAAQQADLDTLAASINVGTRDFTVNGAITAGQPVTLLPNGDVAFVAASTISENIKTTTTHSEVSGMPQFEGENTNPKFEYVSDNTYVTGGKVNNQAVLVLMTADTTSVSYGTPVVVNSTAGTEPLVLAYNTVSNIGVVLYKTTSGNFDPIAMKSFTISGSTITLSSETVLSNSDRTMSTLNIMAMPDGSFFGTHIGWSNGGQGGTIFVVDSTGSISYSQQPAGWDSNTSPAFVSYNPTYGKVYVAWQRGTVTGTSIACADWNNGSPSFDGNSETYSSGIPHGLEYNPVTDKLMICFFGISNQYQGMNSLGSLSTNGTVSIEHASNKSTTDAFVESSMFINAEGVVNVLHKEGTTTGSQNGFGWESFTDGSFGPNSTFYSDPDIVNGDFRFKIGVNPNGGIAGHLYNTTDGGGLPNGWAAGFTQMIIESVITPSASNFVGISNASVTSATAEVVIAGGLSTNHTGLSVGSSYYVQSDGSLSTTTSSVKAGTAIDATTILVSDHLSDSTDLSDYASKVYVDNAVANADPDLSSYPNTTEMTSAIATAKTEAQTYADDAVANADVDLSGYSTTSEMNSAITAEVANVVDAAPAALDTLNELAAALGDDANFASTVTTSLADKASQVDLTAETTRATSAETINNQAIAILQNQVSGISTSSGSTDIEMQANVDMATNKISNLGTPTSGTDAATKAYVDSGVAGVDLSGYSTTAEMNTAISNADVDLSGYSTTAEMNSAITAEVANVVDAAPASLDTLNELAAALGDDANFASTVTTSLASKADDAATTAALATKADASAVATTAQGALADTAVQPEDLGDGISETNLTTIDPSTANWDFPSWTAGGYQHMENSSDAGFTSDKIAVADSFNNGSFDAIMLYNKTNGSTIGQYPAGRMSGISGISGQTTKGRFRVSDDNHFIIASPQNNSVWYGDLDSTDNAVLETGSNNYGGKTAISNVVWAWKDDNQVNVRVKSADSKTVTDSYTITAGAGETNMGMFLEANNTSLVYAKSVSGTLTYVVRNIATNSEVTITNPGGGNDWGYASDVSETQFVTFGDSNIYVHNLSDGSVAATIPYSGSYPDGVAIDGNSVIATGGTSGTIYHYNISTGFETVMTVPNSNSQYQFQIDMKDTLLSLLTTTGAYVASATGSTTTSISVDDSMFAKRTYVDNAVANANSAVATSAQGAKADTAVQPEDFGVGISTIAVSNTDLTSSLGTETYDMQSADITFNGAVTAFHGPKYFGQWDIYQKNGVTTYPLTVIGTNSRNFSNSNPEIMFFDQLDGTPTKLSSIEGPQGVGYGETVVFNDEYFIVSAHSTLNPDALWGNGTYKPNTAQGAVYVYKYDSTNPGMLTPVLDQTWSGTTYANTNSYKLDWDEGEFGKRIIMVPGKNEVIISDPTTRDTSTGEHQGGRIYHINLVDGSLIKEFITPSTRYSMVLGRAGLALSGDNLFVGEGGRPGGTGKVHQFSLSTGNHIRALENPNNATDSNNTNGFGTGITIVGDYMVVGTLSDSNLYGLSNYLSVFDMDGNHISSYQQTATQPTSLVRSYGWEWETNTALSENILAIQPYPAVDTNSQLVPFNIFEVNSDGIISFKYNADDISSIDTTLDGSQVVAVTGHHYTGANTSIKVYSPESTVTSTYSVDQSVIATKAYVDSGVAGVDLSGYSTTAEMDSAIAVETAAAIAAIPSTDLTPYSTTTDINAAFAAKLAEANAYSDQVVASTVDAAPAALDTLNELAAALGDDANFASTVTTSLASKADDAATTAALALKANSSDLVTLQTNVEVSGSSSNSQYYIVANTGYHSPDYPSSGGWPSMSHLANVGAIYLYDKEDLSADPIILTNNGTTDPNNLYPGFDNPWGEQLGKSIHVTETHLFASNGMSYNFAVPRLYVWDLSDLSAEPTVLTHPDWTSGSGVIGHALGYEPEQIQTYGNNLFVSSHLANKFYVYDISDLSQAPTVISNPDTGNTNNHFSKSIQVDEDSKKLYVGAPNGTSGKFFVYDLENLQTAPIEIVSPNWARGFGISLNYFGNKLVVGDQDQTSPRYDSIYVYDTLNINSTPTQYVDTNTGYGNNGSEFGRTNSSVFIDSRGIVIGAPRHGPATFNPTANEGAVFVIPMTDGVLGSMVQLSDSGLGLTSNDWLGTNVSSQDGSIFASYQGRNENDHSGIATWSWDDLSASPTKLDSIAEDLQSHAAFIFNPVSTPKTIGEVVTDNTAAIAAEAVARTAAIAATDARTAGISVDSDSNVALSVGIEMGQNNIKDVNDVYAARGFIDHIESNDLKVQTGTVDFEGSIVNFGSSTITGSGFGNATKTEVDQHLNIPTANAGEFVKWTGTDYEWTDLVSGRLATDQLQVASGGSIAITGPGGTFDFQDGIVMLSGSDVRVDTPTDVGQAANKGYVDGVVAATVDAAPAALDTLNELAAALGDDANFASTITNSLATKANTADVATAAQGAKADSALQPGDAVSLTVDNSEKLDGQQSSHFRIDIYDINGNIVN